MRFDIPNRTPLLRPIPAVSTGALRESLHSVIRRVAEKNHLSLATVVNQVLNPVSNGPPSAIQLANDAMYLISKGEGISGQWIHALNATADIPNLWQQTLKAIAAIDGVGMVNCSHWRKWCSQCFEEDAATELGPYDRLLWSIEDVGVCTRHNTLLRSCCPSCGRSRLPVLTGNDISGFCPNCQAWLGGRDVPLPKGDDDYGRYLLWKTRSFVDLLDADTLPKDASENVLEMFRILRDLHCEGVDEKFAMAVGRNRSVICTWLKKKARPSWKALCEISYVFHVPLTDLLRAEKDAIALSMVRSLPLQTARVKRKQAKKKDLEEIEAFYLAVREDAIPRIKTITCVGRHLGITTRELRRIFSDQTKELTLLLKSRQLTAREKTRVIRLRTLASEVESVVRKMLLAGVKLSRRSVDRRLRSSGISVLRREASIVRQLVSDTASLLIAESETNRF